MRPSRRFSHAIAEGDGISLLAAVDGPEAARAADADGAEAVVTDGVRGDLREATELPILVLAATPAEAHEAGADAVTVAVDGLEDEDGRLEGVYSDALERGLDCVIAVRDEDELQLALDRLDPEIFLLSARGGDDEADPLERVLALLPDVPAGKLAIADVEINGADAVAELERAGVDAVIVGAGSVAEYVGTPPPAV
jgi:indole-3-glycerol phosphate synthase